MQTAATKRNRGATIDLTADSDDEAVDTTSKKAKSDKEQRANATAGYHLTHLRRLPHAENAGCRTLETLFAMDGALREIVVFTFVADMELLFGAIPPQHRSVPLTLVHGMDRDGSADPQLAEFAAAHPNVRLVAPWTPQWGTHHTKMLLLFTADNRLRIVIHTANLTSVDWHVSTQGCWISPPLPVKARTATPLPDFEVQLVRYLTAYGRSLAGLVAKVQTFDYSSVRAALIASVPGRHTGDALHYYGHMRLRHVLGTLFDRAKGKSSDLFVAQCSSVGNVGPGRRWLDDFASSLAASTGGPENNALDNFRLVYPSCEDVLRADAPQLAAGHLIFQDRAWTQNESLLKPRMCRWSASAAGRPRSMPHIKTYARIDPDSRALRWFLLTSANTSRPAWGSLEKNGTQLSIRSYELGVLLLPELWERNVSRVSMERITAADARTLDLLPISTRIDRDCKDVVIGIRLPYDVPLRPYGPSDEPWTWSRTVALLGGG